MNPTKTLLTLAFAAVCGAAFAQAAPPAGDPQGGPQNGPGGNLPGGPGRGPGNGPGRQPLPPRGGPRWLLQDAVRKELRLTAAQVETIRNLKPTPPPAPKGLPQGENVRPPAPELGPDPMEASLKGVLDADQFARFRQLRLQHEGAGAIRRPDVAKELGLTDAQIESLRPTPPAPPKEGEAPQPPKAGERPDRKREDARVLAGLTDAQRARWREMTGRPFDFGAEDDEPPMPEGPQP